MRFIKTQKERSSNGGIRHVSMRFPHIVRRDSNELSPEPQLMLSCIDQAVAFDFASVRLYRIAKNSPRNTNQPIKTSLVA